MGNTPINGLPQVRPPMKIHQIHGKNLTITAERLVAERHEGYSDGLFFGSRIVFPDEQLEITVLKIINEWNGALRFGFTTHNPIAIDKHPEGIPRYMCPDLIKRGGSFVETISQISLRVNDKIVFWYEKTGEVNLKVNEVMQKCQLHGIKKDVWPVVDVYGNTVKVSFRCLQDKQDKSKPVTEPRFYSSLKLNSFHMSANHDSVELIDVDTVRRIQTRKAYAWNKNPFQINTVWVLFINEVDHCIGNNLSIAILKTPPQLSWLPDTFSDFGRNNGRAFDNVYTRMMVGDELAICILENGVVLVAINGEQFEELGKVTPGQHYWVIADLNCSLTNLRSVGIYKMTRYPLPKLPTIDNIPELEIMGAMSSLSLDSKKSISRDSSISSSFEETPRPEINRTDSQPVSERKSTAECVICLDNPPDNVFIPCGHVCCCKSCADNLMNEHSNLCPACRKKIDSSFKVFL